MTLVGADRPHWPTCWRHHHDCAIARIEHLEAVVDEQVAHARPASWHDPGPRVLDHGCNCADLHTRVDALERAVSRWDTDPYPTTTPTVIGLLRSDGNCSEGHLRVHVTGHGTVTR